MKSKATTSASRSSGRKPTKPGKLPKPPKVQDFPELQDRFVQETTDLSRKQLLGEHEEQMTALRQLHQAQIWNIREQLQLALFKIWNEMWLQKKAAQNKAHKEFLKVLAA